jgi:hypothetical protein
VRALTGRAANTPRGSHPCGWGRLSPPIPLACAHDVARQVLAAAPAPRPPSRCTAPRPADDCRRIALLRYKALRSTRRHSRERRRVLRRLARSRLQLPVASSSPIAAGRPAPRAPSVSSASRRWPLPAMECLLEGIEREVGGDLTILRRASRRSTRSSRTASRALPPLQGAHAALRRGGRRLADRAVPDTRSASTGRCSACASSRAPSSVRASRRRAC